MADASTREKTILCVDDDELGLHIRQAMLHTFGFETRLATSGAAALEMMDTMHFDALVVDDHMPERDGAELVDIIKKRDTKMPIVMLTGYPHDVPPRTLQLVDAMIVKGEGPEKLLETLLRLTGSRFKRQPMTQRQMSERNLDQVHAVTEYLKTQRQGRH